MVTVGSRQKGAVAVSDNWAASIEEINNARDTALLRLAARYRDEVLLPLCKKYCLTYSSGMGMVWFGHIMGKRKQLERARRAGRKVVWAHSADLNYHEPEEAKKHGFDLDAVFAVLNLVDDYNSVFGYYVVDIDENEVAS